MELARCPLIHQPQDVMVIQTIIFETKSKAIIETGIARGGSLVLHASLMKMTDCITEETKSQ